MAAALVEEGGFVWAGILFSEDGELLLGPQAGVPQSERRTQVPVLYEDAHVAELAVDGCEDPALLERVAALISTHCLVGWDTGGAAWDAVG